MKSFSVDAGACLDYSIPLSEKQCSYVSVYLRGAGYEPNKLSEEDWFYFFYYLSRIEELDPPLRHSNHNWEISFASLERREQQYIPILERKMAELLERGHLRLIEGASPRWPDSRPFCLCLTHDIDILHGYLWRERLRVLRHLQNTSLGLRASFYGSAVYQLIRRLSSFRSDVEYPLEMWLEAEAEFGFHSTFFFLADPFPPVSWEDTFYYHSDQVFFDGIKMTIGELIREVALRGWDVGLHGSSLTYDNLALLRQQRKMMSNSAGTNVTSSRQHHLIYDVRITPAIQSRAGLQTDSSLGLNYGTGFRCGTGLPFFMYDLAGDEALPLLQIPLTVQDIAIAMENSANEELILRHVFALMDRVEQFGSVLCLLWHNNVHRDSMLFRCYRAILKEAHARGAWGCSLRELDVFWRDRSFKQTGKCR